MQSGLRVTDDDPSILRVAYTFDALREPNRLIVFRTLLLNGAINVGLLARATNMSDALMSQHLKILFNAQLVVRERQGKHVFYRVNTMNPMVEAIEQLLSSK